MKSKAVACLSVPATAFLKPEGHGALRWLLSVAISVFLAGSVSARATWYVDASAAGGGNGSPGNPFQRIVDGIGAAVNGDTVFVLPGTYVEKINFLGKAITVRSAAGAASTTIDGNQAGSVVTFSSGETQASILRGFTITNGTGTTPPWGQSLSGGGIYAYESSPQISDCIISQNHALEDGGGIYCVNNSSATVSNCIIRDNTAKYGAGFYSQSSSALASGCVIQNNTAWGSGGGFHCNNDSSNSGPPKIENCLILDNTAARFGGGGGKCSNTTARIVSCTFNGNQCQMGGGGIRVSDDAYPHVIDCILWGNVGAPGPEILINLPPGGLPSTLTISYSDVQGGQALVQVDAGCTLNWGAGMINLDPLFIDSVNGDYRLQQDPCQPGVVNPCVDTGSKPTTSLPWTTRTDLVQDSGIVDMGYHYDIASIPGIPFCYGDPGSGTACPCSNDNDGSVPGSGCDNGVFASGARLTGSGTASVSADTLILTAVYLEPNNSGLYFQADNDLSPGIVWGDGLRCAGGNLRRLQVRFADAAGTSSTTVSVSAKAGNISPGNTKRYQCWYRTTVNPPCGVGVNDFNLSNGYEIVWLP